MANRAALDDGVASMPHEVKLDVADQATFSVNISLIDPLGIQNGEGYDKNMLDQTEPANTNKVLVKVGGNVEVTAAPMSEGVDVETVLGGKQAIISGYDSGTWRFMLKAQHVGTEFISIRIQTFQEETDVVLADETTTVRVVVRQTASNVFGEIWEWLQGIPLLVAGLAGIGTLIGWLTIFSKRAKGKLRRRRSEPQHSANSEPVYDREQGYM